MPIPMVRIRHEKAMRLSIRLPDGEQRIKEQYIGGLFRGTLEILKSPDAAQMASFSQAVYNNTPYNKNKELISEGEDRQSDPNENRRCLADQVYFLYH